MRKLAFAIAAALAVTIAGPARRCGSAAQGGDAVRCALQLDRLLSRRPSRRRLCPQGHHRPGAAGAGFVSGRRLDDRDHHRQSRRPSGVVIGGQIGCDYQFAPSWVIGIEGAASGSTMKGRTTVGLPLGNPDTALVQAKTDFLTSVTARFGYAFDNVLLYAKGGVAMAADRYDVTGSFAGTPFGFVGLENRFGWIAGGGVEWAFSPHWSASFEYDYYQFGHERHRDVRSDQRFPGQCGRQAEHPGRQGRIELSHLGARLVMSEARSQRSGALSTSSNRPCARLTC